MKRRGRWFYGLILIAIALLLILSQLGLITATIGIWSILMGVLAAAMLVHGIAERSFFEIFCALGIALVTFDEVLSLPNISVWIVILVVILLSAGFECIFPKRKRTNHHRNNDEKWQPYEDENQTGEYQQVREENRDGHIYCCNRFGAAAKYISSDDLKGAELENSFGELKVYFDNAKIKETSIDIRVNNRFGSMVLYMPSAWNVISDISVFLASSEHESRFTATDGPKVNVGGSVTCGEVKIIYV